MILINKDVLMKGNIVESVLIHSFEEYKRKGGQKDLLDLYASLKERAKGSELNYISTMDQSLSGIPVDKNIIKRMKLIAQAYWYLIHLYFGKELRKVSYSTFTLEEFNKL